MNGQGISINCPTISQNPIYCLHVFFWSRIKINISNQHNFKMEHPCWTLSGLSLIGGIIGYSRKGSKASLIAGLGVSGIYLTAGYLLKENKEYGIHTALLGSNLLLIGGIQRLIATRHNFSKKLPVVPALLTIMGGLATAYYAGKYNEFYM